MGFMIKEPPVLSKRKDTPIPKADKSYIQRSIYSQAREYIETADGKQITKWDGIVQRMFDIGLYAESNADAISAAKWLADRVLGKAAVMKDEETKPIPKVIFAVNETALEDLSKKAKQAAPEFDEDEQEAGVLVQTDDGQEMIV